MYSWHEQLNVTVSLNACIPNPQQRPGGQCTGRHAMQESKHGSCLICYLLFFCALSDLVNGGQVADKHKGRSAVEEPGAVGRRPGSIHHDVTTERVGVEQPLFRDGGHL